MIFPTWRKPIGIITAVVVAGVALISWKVNVEVAAYFLAVALGVAAVVRFAAPEKHVLTSRGRVFDASVLALFSLGLLLLAPWGLAQAM